MSLITGRSVHSADIFWKAFTVSERLLYLKRIAAGCTYRVNSNRYRCKTEVEKYKNVCSVWKSFSKQEKRIVKLSLDSELHVWTQLNEFKGIFSLFFGLITSAVSLFVPLISITNNVTALREMATLLFITSVVFIILYLGVDQIYLNKIRPILYLLEFFEVNAQTASLIIPKARTVTSKSHRVFVKK